MEKLAFIHLNLLTHCKMKGLIQLRFFISNTFVETYRISGDLSGPRETMLSAL